MTGEAKKYAKDRVAHLISNEVEMTPSAVHVLLSELELAFRAGSIHAKEKAIETVQEAFGADFAGPLKAAGPT